MSDRTDPPDRSSEELTHFARETRAGVVPPTFDSLVAVQRRRRRATLLGTAGATVAAVALVATTVQTTYDDQSTPTPPATSTDSSAPSPSPTTDEPSPDAELTATQIVNSPGSRITSVAVAPSDPDVRAVAWKLCGPGRSCSAVSYAVTVTDDGFATSHDVALGRSSFPDLRWLQDNVFLLEEAPHGRLITSNGAETPLQLTETTRSVAVGEVLVSSARVSDDGYVALDPDTGRAHPITRPPDPFAFLAQASDGRLSGITYSSASAASKAVWSTDGGATWAEHELPSEFNRMLVAPIPSEVGGVMAFAVGGDGATLFPFDKVYRSLDGGATWETIEESPGDMAYLGWSLVRPDGSLLVKLDAWSDDRAGKPGSHPRGFYQSSGLDWADMRFVLDLPTSAPADLSSSGFEVADYAVTDDGGGGVRLWISTYDADVLYEWDAGTDTWREIPAR